MSAAANGTAEPVIDGKLEARHVTGVCDDDLSLPRKLAEEICVMAGVLAIALKHDHDEAHCIRMMILMIEHKAEVLDELLKAVDL